MHFVCVYVIHSAQFVHLHVCVSVFVNHFCVDATVIFHVFTYMCVFVIRQFSSILSPLQSPVASVELQQRSGTQTNIPVTTLKTIIPALLPSQQYDINNILPTLSLSSPTIHGEDLGF